MTGTAPDVSPTDTVPTRTLTKSLSARKRWQFAVFQLRKNSAIAKLDVDNDDETVYDGKSTEW